MGGERVGMMMGGISGDSSRKSVWKNCLGGGCCCKDTCGDGVAEWEEPGGGGGG